MNILMYIPFGESNLHHNSSLLGASMKSLCEERGHSVKVISKEDISEGCIGCRSCISTGKCVHKDVLKESLSKEYDAICIISPVYFFGLPSFTKKFLDRLFCFDLCGKIFSLVLTSGSQFKRGGVDLILDMFSYIDSYCGSFTISPYNKVTFDEVLPVTSQDILGLKDLIDRTEEAYHEGN